jgi:c-di-GMP-binding flagellar brake protein YcgR
VRSAIEIGRTLEALHASAAVLSATLADDVVFVSRLLQVNPGDETILVAFSEFKAANAALLARPSVVFTCHHGGLRHEFMCVEPREVALEAGPAIRFAFPRLMLSSERRTHARFPVPPTVPLRCVIGWGTGAMEGKVVDISRGGLGCIVLQPAAEVPAGTRIEGVRISHPERTVSVDIEVRHAERMTTPEGAPATRLGCRFLGEGGDLDDLVALFVTEVGG